MVHAKFKYLIKRDGFGQAVQDVYTEKELLDLIVIRDESDGMYYVFTRDEFWMYYGRKVDKHFHEVIFSSTRQKIRFDIDGDANLTATDGHKLVADLIKVVIDDARCIWNIDLTLDDFLVTDSSDHTKFSTHVILNTYNLLNSFQVAEFCVPVIKKLKLSRYVDETVYKRIQNFRMVGCSKLNSTRVKKITTFYGTPDFDVKDSLISGNYELKTLPAIVLNEKTHGKEPVVTDRLLKKVLETVARNGLSENFIYRERKGNLLLFDRIKPSLCRICDKVHETDNTLMVRIYEKNGEYTVYEYCRRTKGTSKGRILEETDEKITAVSRRIRDINSGKIDPTKYKNAFDSLPDRLKTIYNSNVMRPYPLARTLVIRAQMKMGKTKELRAYIDKYFKDDIIRVVSFRQTFSAEFKRNFPEFVLYSQIKGDITDENAPKLIIQAESLHRLKIPASGEGPGLTIYDESESVSGEMNSGLHKNIKLSTANLRWLTEHTKYLVLIDANADRCTKALADLFRKEEITYVCNTYLRAKEDTFYITGNEDSWNISLFNNLSKGKRVAIASNCLKKLEELMHTITHTFPEKKTLICSSKMNLATKNEMATNLETYWILDVLGYSPVVAAGNSFETKHYDVIYGYMTDKSCDVETSRQMLARIRDVKDKEYIIYLKGVRKYLPETYEEVRRYIKHRQNACMLPGLANNIDYIYKGSELVANESDVFKLWAELIIVSNKSKNSFINRFIDQVASTGATIKDLPDMSGVVISSMPENIKKYLKDSAKEYNQNEIELLYDAENLDELSVIDIKDKVIEQIATENDILAYNKYLLATEYRVPTETLSTDFIKNYSPMSSRRIYQNLYEISYSGTISESIELIRKKEAKDKILNELTDEVVKLQKMKTEKGSYAIHMNALHLLYISGFQSIVDKTTIYIYSLAERYRSNIKNLCRIQPLLQADFGIKKLDLMKIELLSDSDVVKSILKIIVNPVLKYQYGIELKGLKRIKDIYHIVPTKIGKLFNIDGNVKGMTLNKFLPSIGDPTLAYVEMATYEYANDL